MCKSTPGPKGASKQSQVSYEVKKNLQVNIVSHGSKSCLIQYIFIKL